MSEEKKHKLFFKITDAKVEMYDNGELVKSGKVMSVSEVLEYLGVDFEVEVQNE